MDVKPVDMKGQLYLYFPAGHGARDGAGTLTLAELTVVEVPWLPVDEPVSL